jgi:hypothetical protein
MNAAERSERNQKALALFIGGATYIQIAAACNLRTASAAHKIVEKELREASQRRLLLSDAALEIHQERQERLLLAHWPAATRAKEPDHRSAEICRRILAQQARFYGLDGEAGPALPAPTATAPPPGDGEDEDNELAQFRARRGSAG